LAVQVPTTSARRSFVRAVVRKWGNSAALRIPAPVMAAARLSLDQPVEVREEDGRIVIEPLPDARFDLGALLDGITDENRHDAAEFGSRRGREAW
jgi:antitoxin MazE